MKLGVYIGSFNPVHKGHEYIINNLLTNKTVDKMLMVATSNYWNKTNLISAEHRINMLKLVNSNILIETKYNNTPYTYELMRLLKTKYNNYELYLIIGADNIVNFKYWKNYKELLELNLIIIGRNNIDIKYHLDRLNKKDKYIIINSDIDISSTSIRNNIELNKKNLNKKVYKYIKDNKLYER